MASHIKLDECSSALLSKLGVETCLSTDDIVQRLLGAHISELHELDAFLEVYPAGTPLHEEGVNLLVSYGPESIEAGIKRIAPGYKTLAERFQREIAAVLPLTSENSATGL